MRVLVVMSKDLMWEWVEKFTELPFTGTMYLAEYGPYDIGINENWIEVKVDPDTWYAEAIGYKVGVNPNMPHYMLKVIAVLGYDNLDLWYVPNKEELYVRQRPSGVGTGNSKYWLRWRKWDRWSNLWQ